MFSGIRYIFGYNEETVTQAANGDSASSASETTRDVTPLQASLSIETSTSKLEQTLNAATTKFTEQLLPQQASIEELQTSNHQLLPSITEQHEEGQLWKKGEACGETEAIDDDVDVEGFNADSWELLDLVEQAEVDSVGLTSSVQKGDTTTRGLCKSTGGILKSQNSGDENGHSQRRQKPKVSFEAPELVRSKHEIEQTMSNATAASGSDNVECAEKFELVGKADCKKVPILNYAKALSKKLATGANADPTGSTLEPRPCSSTTNDENGAKVSTDSIGPVKRVRPTRISTSSWSSHDEDDNIEQVDSTNWEVSNEKNFKQTTFGAAVQIDDDADNDSIISSGFSDCDYGFGGINDYVVRPKKANGKRGRTVSGSSSSINRMILGRSERKATNAKAKLTSAVETKNGSKSTDAKDSKSEISRNSKSKKKRMIMTANKSVNLSDFLKNKPGNTKEVVGQNTHKLGLGTSLQVAQKPTVNGGSTESSDIAEMDESWFVTPPPCFTKAAETDNSHKVESPKTKDDDQENALIEHPSVYIANAAPHGHAKVKSGATAKLKSVGVAKTSSTSSKQDSIGESLMTPADELWNSDEDESGDKSTGEKNASAAKFEYNAGPSAMQMGKISDSNASEINVLGGMKAPPSTANSNAKDIKKKPAKLNEKTQAQSKSASVALKPSENKAWKNKFIVDVWDLDDNDDVDSDFDSLFEPAKKRKSTKIKKPQQKQTKGKELAEKSLSSGSTEIASFDYSPSSSVELLSVKSLVSAEFENHENLQPEIKAMVANEQQVEDEPRGIVSQISKAGTGHRRPPTQVRPLEPERVPSWQLKRQRSKRRPLTTAVSVVNKQQNNICASKSSKAKNDPSASASSSSRSTPTLIDRIGCSIVANLTNLTSGLVSSGAMNYCQSNGQPSMMENQDRTIANKSNFGKSAALASRKQLSRGSMRRQNICTKQGNTLRRPDRRLKLFATLNGCSINRKVHTNIH